MCVGGGGCELRYNIEYSCVSVCPFVFLCSFLCMFVVFVVTVSFVFVCTCLLINIMLI